jgi:hypothetical protein
MTERADAFDEALRWRIGKYRHPEYSELDQRDPHRVAWAVVLTIAVLASLSFCLLVSTGWHP